MKRNIVTVVFVVSFFVFGLFVIQPAKAAIQWVYTGSMSMTYNNARLVLLQNGKVLMLGGSTQSGVTRL